MCLLPLKGNPRLKPTTYVHGDNWTMATRTTLKCPCNIVMTGYERRKTDGTKWFSEPFYSHDGGYKMRLQVDAKGHSTSRNTFLSVWVSLMKGEFDGQLKWPFRGQVTVELLSQSGNPEHFVRIVNFTETTSNDVVGRVKADVAKTCWGYSTFIPHANLKQAKKLFGSAPPQYLKDDCLRFRVTNVQLTPEYSAVNAATVEFVMTSFEEHKRQGYWWRSAPFYTSRPGYKMCIGVLANGGKPNFIENLQVGAYLMKGEFDDRLSWPFRGHVHIQLRNQLDDSNHIVDEVCFNETNDPVYRARVQKPPGMNERANCGWTKPLVAKGTNALLPYQPNRRTQYVKNNSLVLRVLKVEVPSLRIGNGYIVVPNFEKLKRDGDCFYSQPFSICGYKMCMAVWPNGKYHGMGTHISLYFHMMRGDNDSRLAWPFRGRITLQIVNHAGPLCFHETLIIDESPLPRVLNAEMSSKSLGLARCIPHSLLPTRKKHLYIKDGCLHIRLLQYQQL